MGITRILRTSLFLGFLAVGLTFLGAGTAYAVADLNVAVTDSGTTYGGATLTLTSPDGTTQTYKDDDNDGRFGIILPSSGRYRMTITTADGRSSSTSFRAPSDGTVQVDYDAAGGSPSVTVNDNGYRGASSSPWSFNLLSTFGFTDWEGQYDNGGSVTHGQTENMRKDGVGGGFRYDMPNFPLFLMSNFFYHAKAHSANPFQSGSSGLDLEIRERWKWQFMLGWTFMHRPKFAWALMVGVTLARIQLNVLSSGSVIQHEQEIQAAPTFGTELAFSINQADSLFFVLGATAAIMNSISHNISGTNQFLRADNDLQWDTYAGLRFRF